MNRIVLGTLLQRWLRTLFTGLSTLVAFMLLAFLLAIRHGFSVEPAQVGADLLLIQSVSHTHGLPIGMLSKLTALPDIRSAAAFVGRDMRFGTDPHPVGVEGLSSNAFLAISGLVSSGALSRAQAQAWLADPTGALVSLDAARKHGWQIGQTLVLHTMPGELPQNLTAHVDGILPKSRATSFTDAVNLHLKYFRQWAHTDDIDVIFAQVKQADQTDTVARAIELKFANSTTPVSVQSFKSLLRALVERLADVNTLTYVVIVASLFGLFLICFNTEIHSVSERLGEFGLLKALGFAPKRLLWLVFLEAFLTIVPAAVTGIFCALLIIWAFAAARLHLPGIALTPAAFAVCVLAACGLAILSSILPAMRILHLNCSQALRKS